MRGPAASRAIHPTSGPIDPGADADLFGGLEIDTDEPLDEPLEGSVDETRGDIDPAIPRLAGDLATEPAPDPSTADWTWLERFEHAWLGRVSGPWQSRVRRTGWRPEPLEDACPRCGLTRAPNDTHATNCDVCQDRPLPWDRFVRLGVYRGVLAAAIRDLKFRRDRPLGQSLGRLLAERLLGRMREENLSPTEVVVVPVPTTLRRRWSRGIDHSLVLARAIGWAAGVRVCPVLRRRHRPSQVSLPPTRRRGNVRGTMRWGTLWPWQATAVTRASVIVVVDDVRTTGSTMGEACRTIRRGLLERGINKNQTAIWAATLGAAMTAEEAARRRQQNGEAWTEEAP